MARLSSSNFQTYTVSGQTVILEDDIKRGIDHPSFLAWKQYTRNVPRVMQMGRVFFASGYVDEFFTSYDEANVFRDSFWDNQIMEPCLYMNQTNAFITAEDSSLLLIEPA